MSSNGLVATVIDLSTPNLVRGADLYITTQVSYTGDDPTESDGPAYAFQGLTACCAVFANDPAVVGAPIAVTGTVLAASYGLAKFAIPAASSPGLLIGDSLQFEQIFADARGNTILIVPSPPIVDKIF